MACIISACFVSYYKKLRTYSAQIYFISLLIIRLKLLNNWRKIWAKVIHVQKKAKFLKDLLETKDPAKQKQKKNNQKASFPDIYYYSLQ